MTEQNNSKKKFALRSMVSALPTDDTKPYDEVYF